MLVELDGKQTATVFITNNTAWAASRVGALSKSRWGIEVFFNQIKQTLRISDFLGNSKHAIRWQLWAALLLYLLLRHHGQPSNWPHSFSRLFTILHGLLWDKVKVVKLREHYRKACEIPA